MLEIKIILLSQSTLDLESTVKAAATGTAWLKTRDDFTTHCIAASRLGCIA